MVLGRIADGSFRLKKKALKTRHQYLVLEELVKAFPGTVTARRLKQVCGDGPNVYQRLADSDEDLRSAMREGAFGLIDPRNPNP